MQTEPIENYLVADSVIDWHDNAIREVAHQITAGLTDNCAKAKAVFEWVRDQIPHSSDARREEITCSASQVLAVGTGICYAKAHLLAALCRASGIPAGFCYQVYYEECHVSESKIALHGLNAVYLESFDKWIRVDPRGNKETVNAQFDTNRECLAFPDLDFLNDYVYAAPLPQVVRELRSWPTRAELWPHLPTP